MAFNFLKIKAFEMSQIYNKKLTIRELPLLCYKVMALVFKMMCLL